MEILAGTTYTDQTEDGTRQLSEHINGIIELELFDGPLDVYEGKISADATIIHARSLAENVGSNE